MQLFRARMHGMMIVVIMLSGCSGPGDSAADAGVHAPTANRLATDIYEVGAGALDTIHPIYSRRNTD